MGRVRIKRFPTRANYDKCYRKTEKGNDVQSRANRKYRESQKGKEADERGQRKYYLKLKQRRLEARAKGVGEG